MLLSDFLKTLFIEGLMLAMPVATPDEKSRAFGGNMSNYIKAQSYLRKLKEAVQKEYRLLFKILISMRETFLPHIKGKDLDDFLNLITGGFYMIDNNKRFEIERDKEKDQAWRKKAEEEGKAEAEKATDYMLNRECLTS